MAAVMSIVGTFLGMQGAGVLEVDFLGTYLTGGARGFGISYLIGVAVSIVLPLQKWTAASVGRLKLTPSDGGKYGAVMAALINMVYTDVLSGSLSFINVVVIGGAPPQAFVMSFLRDFIPCYLVSYLVSLLWAPRADAIARRLMNDPGLEVVQGGPAQ